MTLGSFDRDRSLQALAETTFDVLVVGGGITGAGVALDAASRGLRTTLVERDDFASGTSSKSSKLVHGGLRYLQNGDVRLVYEALRERQRLRHNAPHLVRLLPFLIPLFSKDGLINPKIARALGSAMWMYDLTGGARIGKLHKRLKRGEAVAHMPTLSESRLAGAYLYYDAAADDARLTLTIARTAAIDHGAVMANHTAVVGFLHDDAGTVRGATVEAETVDGPRRFDIAARSVVNASGVWSDDVRALDEGTHPDTIRPAKGIHITVPWEKVRNDIAVVVPVPKDKRSVFVVPWLPLPEGGFRFTYIGTTDTDYDGSVDEPQCTPDDVAYLIGAVNLAVREPLDTADVLGTWAGLRPLVKAATTGRTADLSRRHRVQVSASGVVSVTGGKLTTYREMAEDAVDELVRGLDGLPRSARRSRTRRLRLLGADGARSETPDHLADRYGSEARVITAMVDADPSLGDPLVPGLPYLRAEAVHAVRYEMATSVDDVLARRTRARLQARDATADVAADVAGLLAVELGWTKAETARQAAAYVALVEAERAAPELPLDRSRAREAAPMTAPHELPAAGPGAPTPPIALAGDPGATTGRLAAARVEVPDAVLQRLAAICPTVVEPAVLAEASRDWWPQAMIWALDNQVAALAGAVVTPTSAEDVSAVLAVCNEARIPVTAAAGRSGVCGASVPVHGGVVLDLCGLAGVVDVDTTSLVLDVAAGTFGDHLEHALRREHGVTLGHWPQSVALSTVGGWLACRSAGQLSTRYGKIEDMVVGLDVVLADGRRITTGGAPRAAVGPDLSQLFVGSEGTLGIITGARLRLHPAPAHERRAAYTFASFVDGVDAMRRVIQRGATPAVLRLYDATEADRTYHTGDRALLLVLDEGDGAVINTTMEIVAEVCVDAAHADVGHVGHWLERRNDVAALEALISRGYVVDTMEVAGRWRDLPSIYTATIDALSGVEGTIAASAHQSHSYTDGGCLYFTFAAQVDADERDTYYRAVWDAGSRAVLGQGGALSHHHGVGLNRSRFVADALGPAFDVLVAAKQALDPNGILNPGKLGLPSPFGATGY